jgi:hypothetical protein
MTEDDEPEMTPEHEAWFNEVAGRNPIMREMLAAYAEEGRAAVVRYRLSHPEEYDAMMIALLNKIPPPRKG